MRSALRHHLTALVLSLLVLLGTGCSDDGATTPTVPVLTTLHLTLPTTLAIGQQDTATVAGRDADGAPIATGPVVWSSGTPTVATIGTDGTITGVAAGTTQIVATVGARSTQATLTVVAPAAIVINEIESSGGVPGDWVELYNPATTPVDLSGWMIRDNDDSHVAALPAGTVLPGGGFLVVEESTLGYGLGGSDAVRLYSPYEVLVDSHTWTSHAPTTWGRCPDGTGAFVAMTSVTKGSANDCRPAVVVNEVESSGGTPGDWLELYNTGSTPVDLSGFMVRDNDDTHTHVLPAGSVIAAGEFLVVEEAALGYGLGGADAVRLFAPDGATIIDRYDWTAHASTTYGRCPDGVGAWGTTSAPSKGSANRCGPAVRVNEIESSGGTPGDWIELYNAGPAAVDLAGYILRDNDDTHTFALPTGSVIAAGGFLVVEEAALGFGLGGGDAARLFAPDGSTLLDSYTWTAHAAATYGRCPDGTGPFGATTVATKGSANVCGVPSVVWPGASEIGIADGVAVFGGNMSGLTYEGAGAGPGVLWAARNGPGAIFRLVASGGTWIPDPANGWGAGKALRYPDGTGDPDAEGITFAEGGATGGLYVASERNNAASGVSRNAVLRFDPAAAGTTLTATHLWDLTADLPALGANLGIEAITWVPDTWLVAQGFRDEAKGRAYLPADYPDHGTGLFVVGVEGNGMLYVYALDHRRQVAQRVATISSGMPGIMALEFDREIGWLWATCDDGCQGRSLVLDIDQTASAATLGQFVVRQVFDRPAGMPNLNNEGFAMAPQAECVANRKPVFWADDGETGGHAIRRGTVSCTRTP